MANDRGNLSCSGEAAWAQRRAYWRSLEQLADTPHFRQWLESEFPAGAPELADPVSRRHFVTLMSASFLLAGLGLTGCRRPVEKIVPLSKLPEQYLHGTAQFYATAMPGRAGAVPLVVKSYDGRPIKIEGNAQHPDSHGGTDHFAQASILNLYDPDRSVRFLGKTGRELAVIDRPAALDFLAKLGRQFEADGGQGVGFLLEYSHSPSRARLQQLLSDKFPNARWFIHEPVDFDIHRRAATEIFHQPVAPYFKFDQARVIVALDADFLGSEEPSYLHIRRFAQGRNITRPGEPMNRLYAVEALYSLTGANADHRLRVPATTVQAVAAGLALAVLEATGQGSELIPGLRLLAEPANAYRPWITVCAQDLLGSPNSGSRRGDTLVMAGCQQPMVVHVFAHLMNTALGNIGQTCSLLDAPVPQGSRLAELAAALEAGQVNTLVILGGNPVYHAPADLPWKTLQRRAKTVVRLGYYEDETAEVSDWHLPQAHFLESWGDARTADGTLVPVQPLIEPLFGGLTELEVLARLGGLAKVRPYDVVRETFRGVAGDSEEAWGKFLHDGFLAGSAAKPVAVQLDWSAASRFIISAKPSPPPTPSQLEVVFYRSYNVDDGRFNNNGWLQETPDPITKLTWDNAVLISPQTATALGLKGFDPERNGPKAEKGLFFTPVVEITLQGRKVRGPLWIQPGLADNTLGLALGYGREKTGRIGRSLDGRPVGFNAYLIRTTGSEYIASGARLTPVPGATWQLASTQEHGAMEGRPLIREATKDEFERSPQFARHVGVEAPQHTAHIPKDAQGRPKPMYQHPPLNGTHQWGMSVDLTACVGCGTCAVACQAENNIPIVGKDQVARGREMSWLRLDRYFAGDSQDPQIALLPMFCQHCEQAPCETVCPVNATAHDEEGLNLMAYNRCVGTRYCSNNCPYKTRRFNFFDYHRRPLGRLYQSPLASATDGEWELKRWFKDPDRGSVPTAQWDLLKLARNPEVTVRMRGVMEKCTFCVQRIELARIAQKVKAGASSDVRISDGTLQTACQQACPAGAIVFGNTADPNSRVSQLKKRERNYAVLGFLDTHPRVTYLARIRNPNPAMKGGRD